jgi:hypothetical protein
MIPKTYKRNFKGNWNGIIPFLLPLLLGTTCSHLNEHRSMYKPPPSDQIISGVSQAFRRVGTYGGFAAEWQAKDDYSG